MTRKEIIEKLTLNHEAFTRYLSQLSDPDYLFSLNSEKWPAGQQGDHILRSISPLDALLRFPKWLVKLVVKRANRPSRSYEALVERYPRKLGKGGRASGRFIPRKADPAGKMVLTGKIQKTILRLCRSIEKYTEKELDELVLPHPLLGGLTLREMLYFTIYHVEHHHKQAVQNLARSN